VGDSQGKVLGVQSFLVVETESILTLEFLDFLIVGNKGQELLCVGLGLGFLLGAFFLVGHKELSLDLVLELLASGHLSLQEFEEHMGVHVRSDCLELFGLGGHLGVFTI
jgi:hypothetical protein